MSDLQGPDISNHQGRIDWDKAVASGLVDFAIAKASEGVRFVDAWFGRNWAEMARLGLPRGAYHYALPSENSPVDEARFFVRCLDAAGGLRPGDMVWLDMEDPDYPVGDDAGTWSLVFLVELGRLIGFTPGIYTYPSYVTERKMTNPALARFPLWYADYDGTEGPVRGPWDKPALWQYTAEKVIPGMGIRIDHNIFHGTPDNLRALGMPAPQEDEMDRFQPETVTATTNSRGEAILVINYGGEVKTNEGINIVDAGSSWRNAQGRIYDGTVRNNEFLPWHLRPAVDSGE